MEAKPIKYRIELYVDSYINDPIAGFWSSTPFMLMQIGDEIDPCAWSDGNGESYSNRGECPDNSVLEIVGIRHLMMINENGIIQSASVKVKIKGKTD